ncbi:MAG: serine hydrolase [Bacteroidia bacterium]
MKTRTFKYLFIVLILSSCLTADDLNLDFISYQPLEIGDGHHIISTDSAQMNADALKEIYLELHNGKEFWPIRSMLVLRHGSLVAEHYFKDPNDINTQHLIWSCTKQVMGALTGIALEQGVIDSIQDPIGKYLIEETTPYPDKANITIEDLLSMHSGIDYSNDGVGGETDKLLRQIPSSIVDFVLGLDQREVPGSSFHYNDGDPLLLSAIIHKETGKPTDLWANEVLFSKIGLRNYSWRRYKDGIAFGGFGIETTPREMAKFAICVADSGRHEGTQIIPKHWISQMTALQVKTEFDYDFGYQWWIDSKRNIHFMWGHGGQFGFIAPDKDLVVIFTSIPNTQGGYQITADEVLPIVDKIIHSCD